MHYINSILRKKAIIVKCKEFHNCERVEIAFFFMAKMAFLYISDCRVRKFSMFFLMTFVTLQMSLFGRLFQQRGTCMCVSTCGPVFAYELSLNVDCLYYALDWVELVFIILSVVIVSPHTQLVWLGYSVFLGRTKELKPRCLCMLHAYTHSCG